jgi:hypothetical protein
MILCEPCVNIIEQPTIINSQCIHGTKANSVCKKCGGMLCEHSKRKSRCKQCGGNQICVHKLVKQNCKICGGSCYCEHKNVKSRCFECKGSQICPHNKVKQICKDCGGSAYCSEHNKVKQNCKECGGVSICEHNRQKPQCRDCNGSQICLHDKPKSICRDCKGSQICEHNIQRKYCKDCMGSSICKHKKNKLYCKECDGSAYCIHNKLKTYCKTCDGSALCKSSWCETIGNRKYDKYCMYCFINLFPEIPVSRNYKTKENNVVDQIKQTFPQFTWVTDKKVQDGCSLRRPDLLLDMGSHIIIVEIDENKHTDYDCSCEHKRLMQISQDVGHRPIVFIRFNPDDYTDEEGKHVKSCWKLNKLGVMQIMKSKEKEWEQRIDCLKQQIQYWVDHPNEKMVEIIELFY